MTRERKRGKVGTNHNYISRKRAIRKTHLTQNEFRRLCILKGIYPAEPKNNTWIKNKIEAGKVYYRKEDIQWLTHEPIIWKFWEFKIFLKRLKRLKARNDIPDLESVRQNRPFYQLGHIVKERYPTFVEAIRDLDDCLSMLFLYSRFAASPKMEPELVTAARRLTVEFMHYVIESRSLRKAFISVRGFYFQAEIMGQAVTWVSPHEFVIPKLADVDINVMRSFTEFYVQLMGFVNFKLFTSNNMLYPARAILRATDSESSASSSSAPNDRAIELLEALNRPVMKREKTQDEDNKPDEFEETDTNMESGEDVKSVMGLTYAETTKLQSLFQGMRFFLNREVPRETMTFVIRCFGGDVSWHSTTAAGATYDESDGRITHQVVDRPLTDRRLDRVYIQPQWLFDCINCRRLLDVQDYFPGATLPPHLSPFVDDVNVRKGTYVTPDAAILRGEPVQPIKDPDEEGQQETSKKKKKAQKAQVKSQDAETGDRVQVGKQTKAHKDLTQRLERVENKKLAEMMIPTRRKKQLYEKIVKLEKVKAKQEQKLTAKRIQKEKEMRQKVQKSA